MGKVHQVHVRPAGDKWTVSYWITKADGKAARCNGRGDTIEDALAAALKQLEKVGIHVKGA